MKRRTTMAREKAKAKVRVLNAVAEDENGEMVIVKDSLEAKAKGFNWKNILSAMKTGKKYKGLLWNKSK